MVTGEPLPDQGRQGGVVGPPSVRGRRARAARDPGPLSWLARVALRRRARLVSARGCGCRCRTLRASPFAAACSSAMPPPDGAIGGGGGPLAPAAGPLQALAVERSLRGAADASLQQSHRRDRHTDAEVGALGGPAAAGARLAVCTGGCLSSPLLSIWVIRLTALACAHRLPRSTSRSHSCKLKQPLPLMVLQECRCR
jgi:hypothetical protein